MLFDYPPENWIRRLFENGILEAFSKLDNVRCRSGEIFERVHRLGHVGNGQAGDQGAGVSYRLMGKKCKLRDIKKHQS